MDNFVKVIYQEKVYEFEKSMPVREVLKKLNLNSEEHVVIVDGQIYTEDRVIKKGSQVVIRKVTSAG